MNKYLFTAALSIISFQIVFSQGAAPVVLDMGAGDACKADPISFFNKFTGSESLKFEFRAINPTAEEIEKGIDFQIDAVIATTDKPVRIVAHSAKARKNFKPGESFLPKDLFNSEDLLFANKYLSKLKPGKYKLIVSMTPTDTGNRKKYRASRRAFEFVWR